MSALYEVLLLLAAIDLNICDSSPNMKRFPLSLVSLLNFLRRKKEIWYSDSLHTQKAERKEPTPKPSITLHNPLYTPLHTSLTMHHRRYPNCINTTALLFTVASSFSPRIITKRSNLFALTRSTMSKFQSYPELCVFDLDACFWDQEMYTLSKIPDESNVVKGDLGCGEGVVGVMSGRCTSKWCILNSASYNLNTQLVLTARFCVQLVYLCTKVPWRHCRRIIMVNMVIWKFVLLVRRIHLWQKRLVEVSE